MGYFIFILFAIIALIINFLYFLIRRRKTFKNLIKKELSKHNLKYISSKPPKFREKIPRSLKKNNIKVGIIINYGAINIGNMYYRKVVLEDTIGRSYEIWVAITKKLGKSKIIFHPDLKELSLK